MNVKQDREQGIDPPPMPSPRQNMPITLSEWKLILRLRMIRNKGGGFALVNVNKDLSLELFTLKKPENLG